ncbi:MAG: SUMF1/EgtB/PvdO family nonheme iron enzyme, partial [Deltaproteobacteria bacterium]|nr:SUMF1/EgtB/PvdO family nonheme iron enzyme [Deltaproteobacteria bacterium]
MARRPCVALAREVLVGSLVLLGACRRGDDARDATPQGSTAPFEATPATSVGSTASAVPGSTARLPAPPSDPAPSAQPAATGLSDCPDGMLVVAGSYCPAVRQDCLEHTEEFDRSEERRARLKAQGIEPPMSRVSERCMRYRSPSTCLSKERMPLRFCIDRFEWPNREGERPAFAVTWTDARARCESVGKRLCNLDEFNFACEGEDMWPYAYGFERDAKRCNIDRPYVFPTSGKATPHDACMAMPSCKAELEALDQRTPSGSLPDCRSPFGVMDMNGNVNEWVDRPGQATPWRSGLKGGWWGPARSR